MREGVKERRGDGGREGVGEWLAISGRRRELWVM